MIFLHNTQCFFIIPPQDLLDVTDDATDSQTDLVPVILTLAGRLLRALLVSLAADGNDG